jgi:signal peptidase II
MIRLKKIALLFFTLILLVGCDLTSKNVAESELKGKQSQTYLNGSVKLHYAENSGGMLGLGDSLNSSIKIILFRIGVGLALLGILVYLIYENSLPQLEYFALVLFLSGGLGNLINRLFNDGYVSDFIVLQLFGLRTGIFNLADFYVLAGAAVFIFSRMKKPKVITPA